MLISEHFQYRNDVFQSDIFVSDIGITDVDVGCRILPTLRSMSMRTYGYRYIYKLSCIVHLNLLEMYNPPTVHCGENSRIFSEIEQTNNYPTCICFVS
jgi:hypothetical protein